MNRRQFARFSTGICLGAVPAYRLLAALPPAEQHKTGIVLDKLFLLHQLEPGHPESPLRLEMIMRYLARAGLLEGLERLSFVDSIEPHLLAIHTQEHINSIRNRYPDSYPLVKAVVGAALSAVDAVCTGSVRNAFCATRPPGHHATNTGREEGFCFFNAVAVAARYAQSRYNLRNILIVDWDYHHGNGTELAFYKDPDVLFFSTHDYYAYPGTGSPARSGEGKGKGFNINVHLDCGASDEDIIRAFREKLMPAANKFRPELILISAGFDSRKEDLLGCFDITDQGFITLTEMMMTLADKYCDGRLVSILEGGYNPHGLACAAVAHATTLNNYKGN